MSPQANTPVGTWSDVAGESEVEDVLDVAADPDALEDDAVPFPIVVATYETPLSLAAYSAQAWWSAEAGRRNSWHPTHRRHCLGPCRSNRPG